MRVILASLIILFGAVTNGQGRETSRCKLLIPKDSYLRGDLCNWCGCCIPEQIDFDMDFLENSGQNWFDSIEQQSSHSKDKNFMAFEGMCFFEGSWVRVVLKQNR